MSDVLVVTIKKGNNQENNPGHGQGKDFQMPVNQS